MKPKFQTWRRIAVLAILIATNASADAVSDWKALAVQATITGARPNPIGVLDIAMVQAAIYDAVQAIEKRFEPYYVEIKRASGSPVAAAAKAAHDVLVNRFPSPSQVDYLDMTYQQYLLNHGLAETDHGVAVGARAAGGIIALRACDDSFASPAPPPFAPNPASGARHPQTTRRWWPRGWATSPIHADKTFTIPRRAAAARSACTSNS